MGYCHNTLIYNIVKNQPQEEYDVEEKNEEDYNVGNETPAADDDNQSDYAADEGDYYSDDAEDTKPHIPNTTKSTTTSTTSGYTTTTQPSPTEPGMQ